MDSSRGCQNINMSENLLNERKIQIRVRILKKMRICPTKWVALITWSRELSHRRLDVVYTHTVFLVVDSPLFSFDWTYILICNLGTRLGWPLLLACSVLLGRIGVQTARCTTGSRRRMARSPWGAVGASSSSKMWKFTRLTRILHDRWLNRSR